MKRLFITILLVFTASVGFAKEEADIKITEYDLSNGLHVILHQDHTTPNVMVSIMYHVGAKNEDLQRTGFAHLFEHLMFEGSDNIGRGDYFKIVQAAGGSLNANTTQDRTYFFETLPSNQLELALWMESERMLHAKIDSSGVATQKGVVIEERKQSYDNRPYGTFLEEVGKRAFKVHPYRWQTIGSPDDIRNSTFEDVFNFYKTYYVPNNAVLVIVGDIDEKQTREWVDKYFAGIPEGTLPIHRPTEVEPPQTAEIRDTVYDNIQLPGVFMGYHAPAMGTKDAYALEILSDILSGGASSRMKTNITDKGLALETTVIPFFQENPGLIYVIGIANMGGNPKDLETAINAAIDSVRTNLVSEEEFQMAMAAKEFNVASGMLSIASISQSLADNYTYFKDADRINRTLSFYKDITRQDLLDAAKKYLSEENRTVLYYLSKTEEK